MAKAAKTIDYRGDSASLFRDGERPIYLSNDGVFLHPVSTGGHLTATSLVALERKMHETLKAVKLMQVQDYVSMDASVHISAVDAVSWNTCGYVSPCHTRSQRPYGDYYPFDAATVKAAEAVNAKLKKLCKKYESQARAMMRPVLEAVRRKQKVTPETFAKLQK